MTHRPETPHTAAQFMSKKLVTIVPKESLVVAWKIMREKRIRHLPVVDADQSIIGILTDRDLQRAIHTEFDQSGDVRYTIERFAPQESAQDYMSSPVRFVAADTPLITVATQMVEQKISSLIVTDNDEATGIITTDDLLWALIRMLDNEKEPGIKKLVSSLMVSPVGEIAHRLSNVGI
jgi:acetoin utilization protein AcuB